MHRMVSAIDSLAQHQDAQRFTPQHYRPANCPHCGLAQLRSHGTYIRKADRHSPTGQSFNPVAIPRFCCAGCRRTCSRLPSCLSPRRWYDWATQQQALLALLLGLSLRAASAQTGCCRQTLRRWRDWLMARHELFAFHLRSRFPDLGRTTGMDDFWPACWHSMPLSRAMAWLDQDLTVP